MALFDNTSKQGKTVVSESENFFVQLHKMGQKVYSNTGGSTLPVSPDSYTRILDVNTGKILYPTYATVSVNQDAKITFNIDSNIPGESAFGRVYYVKADKPLEFYFNGEVKIYEGGSISVVGSANTTAGLIATCIEGIEVDA